MRRLYYVDEILFWHIAGFTAASEPIYDAPIIIKGRWDTVQTEKSIADRVETIPYSVTVYPDRVLAVGDRLLLGGEAVLNALTEQEIKNPVLIHECVEIKSQSTISEFGRKQMPSYPVGYQSRYITIECRAG